MGSVKDDKEIMTKAFCDDVYGELGGMNMKLRMMIDELALTYGEESEPFKTSSVICWSLRISRVAARDPVACLSFDWKGSRENIESIVSVRSPR